MAGELSDLSDEELMQAYQLGDERAFAVLYGRHSAKVYGYVRGRIKDRAFADDIFQAIFLKLHRTRNHYDPSFPFVPWLFTVCRSALIDGIRKKARIREDLNEVAVSGAVAEEKQESLLPTPDLSSLPESQRQAVELRYGEDLSFEEIAKKLETSPANARQLISRAIRKLKSFTHSDRRVKS